MIESPKKEVDLDLVGVIYDTALDRDFWPALLTGLANEVEGESKTEKVKLLRGQSLESKDTIHADLVQKIDAENEDQLMLRLLPHFRRAFQINSRIRELENQNQVSESIINRMPLGVMVVSANGKILLRNQFASTILEGQQGLMENQGYLQCKTGLATAHLMATLQTLMQQTKEQGWAKNRSISVKSEADEPIQSLYLTCNSIFTVEQEWESNCITILIAAPGHCVNINAKAIQSYFNLTPATSRLAKALVLGYSLDSYAKENRVSINTVRAQLKTLFANTHTHTQSGLVAKILTSPVVFSHENKSTKEKLALRRKEISQPLRDASITLKDGRRLAYAEYGCADGFPVLLFHGTYGSRYFCHPNQQLAKEIGVRLICLDRPGFGKSDRMKRRTILSWAEDVQQFIDTLELTKYSLFGHDAGGCYALACAKLFPERLHSVLVCNSYAPFESLAEYDGAVPNEKLFYSLARYLPSLFIRYSQLQLSKLTNDFAWYYKKITRYLPDCDREIILLPEMISMIYQTSLEGLKDTYGFAKDMVLVTKDWGFDLRDVQVPVQIWHGAQNRYIPPSMGKRLAQQLPHATLNIVEEQGHFLTLSHWQELLKKVLPTGLVDDRM